MEQEFCVKRILKIDTGLREKIQPVFELISSSNINEKDEKVSSYINTFLSSITEEKKFSSDISDTYINPVSTINQNTYETDEKTQINSQSLSTNENSEDFESDSFLNSLSTKNNLIIDSTEQISKESSNIITTQEMINDSSSNINEKMVAKFKQ